MAATGRLSRELRDAQKSTDKDIKLSADKDNIFKWTATIEGPRDTPFAHGVYCIQLRIPNGYPMEPPAATFKTKVFHPNVEFRSGDICLDILKSSWSPAWTLTNVCRAIQALLADPEASSPLNCDAGNLIRAGDFIGFNSIAQMYAITEAGALPLTW